MKNARPDRESIAVLLLQQKELLDIRTIEVAGPHSYHLTMDGRGYRALVLVRSSDFWNKGVHLSPVERKPSLLVVWEHDSCIPIPTLSLKDGNKYGNYATSRDISKRNRYTASVLVGQLMCGIQTAFDRLEHVHPSVKYRYLAKVHRLSHRPRGRPIAS